MGLAPGALWWTNNQTTLNGYLSNGGFFQMVNDRCRCEIIGEIPNLTIVKRDSDPNHECSIVACHNSVRFHGFLWHGELIDIELLARSKEEWDSLSSQDQISVKNKTPPGKIPWPVKFK